MNARLHDDLAEFTALTRPLLEADPVCHSSRSGRHELGQQAGAKHVVLFTDLANPVSNAIYPRLGFRPGHDAVEIAFTPAPHPRPGGRMQ